MISKCKTCGHDIETTPTDKEVEIFKHCGLNLTDEGSDKEVAISIYQDNKTKNSWFYGWFTTTCDICKKDTVLGWSDGCSPSGKNIIHPSSEIRYWPGYIYPDKKIRICKFCHPDNNDPKSQHKFLEELILAMRSKLKA